MLPPDLAAQVHFTRSLRARRLALRVDPSSGTVRLVVPKRVAEAEAWRFALRHAEWIRSRLSRLPAPLPFADGAVLPFLGDELTIRHDPDGPRLVRREGDVLRVGGEAEHLPRRVRDWLKSQARRELAASVRTVAARAGRRVAGMTVRDTRSRWGSCSSTGRLSFSWRLVLAPRWVLDYVVAHEVAHLSVMDHSPAFWEACAALAGDVDAPRAWLRRHGAALMRVG